MIPNPQIQHIDADKFHELEKEAYQHKWVRAYKNYSFQIQAILEMSPGDAIVLAHDGYKCKYLPEPNKAVAACGLQSLVRPKVKNIIGRHMDSTGYSYKSLHVDDNQRVALLCIKEGEENAINKLRK